MELDYDEDGEVIDMPAAPPPGPPPAPPTPPPARQSPPPQRGSAPRQDSSSEPVCRFGNQKGVPLSQLSDGDLEWYVAALQKSVDDPSKAKYRSYNERDLRAAHDEQDRRNANDDPGDYDPPPDDGDF